MNQPSVFDFDVLVIGGGSGGVRSARMAAQRGLRVALVESLGTDGLGGTCVNLGCIPKKLYAYAAAYGHGFTEARGYGWQADPEIAFDWATLKQGRAQEIRRLNGVYAQLLRSAGVTVLSGHARLLDPHTVQIATLHADGSPGHLSYRAERVLIATGGTPDVPDFPGREHVVTSNEAFDLPTLPKHLVVIGGGYIACELACIFLGLGCTVVQLHRGTQVLRGFDDEVRHFAAQEFEKTGLDLRLQTTVAQIKRQAQGFCVTLDDGRLIETDLVLCATGRRPQVAGLGLSDLGIAQGARGEILVNANYQTSVPSVYALGDVTDRIALTPVALGEAMHLVDHWCGPTPGRPARSMDYQLVPTAVFTHPAIACVGLTEAQSRATCRNVQVFRSEFKALRHSLSGSPERTLMKLVVDGDSDRVLGLHMVGAEAGEIVQGFAVALKAGATKAVFDSTLGIHPTAAEEFVTMRTPVA